MAGSIEPLDAAYHHRLVVGYHGCERDYGEAVLLGKAQLQPSANDYDWRPLWTEPSRSSDRGRLARMSDSTA